MEQMIKLLKGKCSCSFYQNPSEPIFNLVNSAIWYYNNSIHSSTDEKPIDIHVNKFKDRKIREIKEKLEFKQKKRLDKINAKIIEKEIDSDFIANKIPNSKLKPKFKEEQVMKIGKDFFTTRRKTKVHKKNLKRKKKFT